MIISKSAYEQKLEQLEILKDKLEIIRNNRTDDYEKGVLISEVSQVRVIENQINVLINELTSATIIMQHEDSEDSVDIDDEIVIEMEGFEDTFILTDYDNVENAITLESPLGKAIYMHKVGDKISFPTPLGKRTATIIAINKLKLGR